MTTESSVVDFNIGVIGAGSWGTALAQLLGTKGYVLDLWVYETDICSEIKTQRSNSIFLPGVPLSKNITPTNDLGTAVSNKDLLLIVVPSHVMRPVATQIAGLLPPDVDVTIVTASKGIEDDTFLTMSGVLQDCLPRLAPRNFCALSGPSFAKEVARGVPTAVTVAASDKAVAEIVQQVFATQRFRVYTSNDLLGIELGGAVKNVIALAAGMIDGLGLGLNTRAALITRGLAELRRLGVKLGASSATFAGLAGIGDLILTCTGDLSRNHTVGCKLGQGMSLQEILADMRMVAEGVKTTLSVYHLSQKAQVDMPITREVYNILYEGASPKDAVYRLMSRDLKQELDEDDLRCFPD